MRYLIADIQEIIEKPTIDSSNGLSIKFNKISIKHTELTGKQFLGGIKVINNQSEKTLLQTTLFTTVNQWTDDIAKVKKSNTKAEQVLNMLLSEVARSIRLTIDEQYQTLFLAETDLQSAQWLLKKKTTNASLFFGDISVSQDSDGNWGASMGLGVGISATVAALGGPVGIIVGSIIAVAAIGLLAAVTKIKLKKESMKIGDLQLNQIMMQWLPFERLVMEGRINTFLNILNVEFKRIKPVISIQNGMEKLMTDIKEIKFTQTDTSVIGGCDFDLWNKAIYQYS